MNSRVKNTHPVDVFVGGKLRSKRLEKGMSQENLGDCVNLTFQQIQKYERGVNRISASKLFELAKSLEIDIGYFFNGIRESIADYQFEMANNPVFSENNDNYAPEIDNETVELITNFKKIKDKKIKANILSFVKSFIE